MKMRLLLFSDYHGASEFLLKIPRIVSQFSPELIVFCGDIVKGYARGNEWLSARADSRPPDKTLSEIKEEASEDLSLYEKFYTVLGELGLPVYLIPGNMDAPKSRYLKALENSQKQYPNLYSIHGRSEKFEDVTFSGFGGEITKDQNEDFFVSISSQNEVIKGLKKAPRMVYVTHSPPLCNKVDLDKAIHKGSPVVNKVLELMQPIANFCGHAHNGRGKETIGNTTIVNPGAFKSGNYAIVDLEPGRKQVKVLFKNCLLMKI
jgi:Icc-related predicted phosphoesterase